MSGSQKDPMLEAHRRVDDYLNIDVPLLISRGQLEPERLRELIGVLGLWMRATVGVVDDTVAQAIMGFVQAVSEMYAHDPRPLAEKLRSHIASAFTDNSALARLKELIGATIAAGPDDPGAQASARFVANAMAPSATPQTQAYFDALIEGTAGATAKPA